jgi:hypothetical protein
VVRPTRKLTNPSHTKVFGDLGTHYIDVAQIKVVVSQPDFSLRSNRAELRWKAVISLYPSKRSICLRFHARAPCSPTLRPSGPAKGVIVAA